MRAETAFEQLFFLTVKINTVGPRGLGSGTGFFYTHISNGQEIPLIVTNRHVIADAQVIELAFNRRKPDGSPDIGNISKITLSDGAYGWFCHPDPSVDIAVCPLVPLLSQIRAHQGAEIFFRTLMKNYVPSVEQVQDLDALENVLFVGYPNGIWDKKSLLPVVRRGFTASPLQVDFEGEPKFLVDASVFGGSSGSPVLLLDRGVYSKRDGSAVVGERFFFLGVVSAVFYKTEQNRVVERFIPTNLSSAVDTREMLDLGIVIKSSMVVEVAEAFAQDRLGRPQRP